MTPGEVARLRLAAQRLVGPPAASPTEAVRWLTASQAQDLPGALVSVALRSGGTLAQVRAALDGGAVVRSWPLRGTLHLVAAEDLGWLLSLLAQRVLTATRRRREELSITDADVEQAREIALAALSGGAQLSRPELFAVWEQAGVATAAQRGVHLISTLALTQSVVWGPLRGRDQLLVRSDDWITAPRRLEREEALGELALRYLRSHGPASVADLARWAGCTLTDARAGVALARPVLEAVQVDGVELLMDPDAPGRLDRAREQAEGVLLLPGFDEYVLGYADRSPQLPAEFFERVVPGRNGMFRPTVVSDGQVVGTWRRTGGPAPEPFTRFGRGVAAGVAAAWAALPS